MLETTPTSLLYHKYLKRYRDKHTMVKQWCFRMLSWNLTSWRLSHDSVKMSHAKMCLLSQVTDTYKLFSSENHQIIILGKVPEGGTPTHTPQNQKKIYLNFFKSDLIFNKSDLI